MWHRQALADYARGLDISPVRPWMLQRLLAGTEYSSYTLAHRGKILAHSDNEACLSCLDYAHVGSQQVLGRLAHAMPPHASCPRLCNCSCLAACAGHVQPAWHASACGLCAPLHDARLCSPTLAHALHVTLLDMGPARAWCNTSKSNTTSFARSGVKQQ